MLVACRQFGDGFRVGILALGTGVSADAFRSFGSFFCDLGSIIMPGSRNFPSFFGIAGKAGTGLGAGSRTSRRNSNRPFSIRMGSACRRGFRCYNDRNCDASYGLIVCRIRVVRSGIGKGSLFCQCSGRFFPCKTNRQLNGG